MAAAGGKVEVGGASFWHTARDGERIELNNRDDISLDAESVAWTVAPIGGSGETIRSDHRAALHLVKRVVDAKRRQAARRRPVQPIPKPTAKRPRRSVGIPADAPVACPRCGEGWPECPLCDGDGFVPRRAAEAWVAAQG